MLTQQEFDDAATLNRSNGALGQQPDTLPGVALPDEQERETESAPERTVGTAPTPEAAGTGAETGVRQKHPTQDTGKPRYCVRSLLGEGGMGRIHTCSDRQIGRQVAMKILRRRYTNQPEAVARFVREARIQGQLEHPSIVPVYDLGRRPDGSVFFTMKRVRGRTLEQIIDGYITNDRRIIDKYPRRKLLRALSSACLAIEIAHVRGVLHRDLKPANIMLGDYGEVYVLDWGLAKAQGVPEPVLSESTTVEVEPGTRTVDGAVMGTPGYMSPEQARGETATMDARADVYSMGAMLYEMLALRPLHDRASVSAVMVSTITGGADARPSSGSPQNRVPAELDRICVKATQLEPKDRISSARELSDAIDRYLDEERDDAWRRDIASSHTEAAEVAARYALSNGVNAVRERVRALKEVGRALAIEPANPDARRILSALLDQPPAQLPPGEVAAAAEHKELGVRHLLSQARHTYHICLALAAAALIGLGLQDMWAVTMLVMLVFAALATLLAVRYDRLSERGGQLASAAWSSAALAWLSALFGPLFFVPGLVTVNTMAHALSAGRSRSTRTWVVTMGALAVVVPLALQLLGVLPPVYLFRDGALVIQPRIHDAFPPLWTLGFLGLWTIGQIVAASVLFGRVHDALLSSEDRWHKYTWQLKQLLPD